ncbi:MAG: LPS export ABC transporter periplasmic protein LptC [Flavobacteriales bacterium]|nr:LPS export ABC transporter periplasmic protein LptC [Flavobacteriales bacterium]MCB9336438.1 LPS export ABC transporter periplasmic protein LptC [Flavobacteriales bacterium]
MIKPITIAYLIPIIFIIGILYSCENDIDEVNAITADANQPIRTGKDVELIYSEKANAKIKVKAPQMKEFAGEKNYMEMPAGIEVFFYDSLQKVTTTLTANYAINRVSENIMEAKNDVIVINEKGEKLNTEHLVWIQDSAKIYSDEFVKITTADEILMGDGLEANEDFTKYKILKLKGIINLKDTVQ